MDNSGRVSINIQKGIGFVTFEHPKGNSLPGVVLKQLADEITKLGKNSQVRVIVLQSGGERAFCAGASFVELKAVDSSEGGKEYFMGFARVILAMKNCPKLIISRVQGKAVGGGVGLIAASDYALALDVASIRLSEILIGLGPFVIGPCVRRKIGHGAFSALSIDAEWRSAEWAMTSGLYADIFPDIATLDNAVTELAIRLAESSVDATCALKTVLWEGTDDWDTLLATRAGISGKLAAGGKS